MPDPLAVPQAWYHPYENGLFEVKAGLMKLGQHAVHGQVESHVFMVDEHYRRYLENKREARRAGLHRFYCQANLTPGLRQQALEFLFARLAAEWPQGMAWDAASRQFTNRWLGWRAVIEPRFGGVEIVERAPAPLADPVADVAPIDAIDFLAANIQEDISLVARDPATDDDWLAMMHICAPHHWDPREKVGRSFGPVHKPVGEIGPISATAPRMIRALVEQGPFFRFAWGFAMNDRLNHHPDFPKTDRELARTDPAFLEENLFVRVERQTVWGFPEAQGALFTIRPYWYRVSTLIQDPERRKQLAAAVRDMRPDNIRYKEMELTRAPILAYLEATG